MKVKIRKNPTTPQGWYVYGWKIESCESLLIDVFHSLGADLENVANGLKRQEKPPLEVMSPLLARQYYRDLFKKGS